MTKLKTLLAIKLQICLKLRSHQLLIRNFVDLFHQMDEIYLHRIEELCQLLHPNFMRTTE